MILVCGIPSERPLALVADALESLGARFTVFNQRRFAAMRLCMRLDGPTARGHLTVDGSMIPLESVRALVVGLLTLPPPAQGIGMTASDVEELSSLVNTRTAVTIVQ